MAGAVNEQRKGRAGKTKITNLSTYEVFSLANITLAKGTSARRDKSEQIGYDI